MRRQITFKESHKWIEDDSYGECHKHPPKSRSPSSECELPRASHDNKSTQLETIRRQTDHGQVWLVQKGMHIIAPSLPHFIFTQGIEPIMKTWVIPNVGYVFALPDKLSVLKISPLSPHSQPNSWTFPLSLPSSYIVTQKRDLNCWSWIIV